MPSLIEDLKGHEVWILWRGDSNTTTGTRQEHVHSMTAPAIDHQALDCEDRRLVILCRDLEIDCFLSTYATSAGGSGQTLLVAPPRLPWTGAAHGRAAVRLASGFLIYAWFCANLGLIATTNNGDWVCWHSPLSWIKNLGSNDHGPIEEIIKALSGTAIHTTRGAALKRRLKADRRVERRAISWKTRSERRLTLAYRRNSTAGPIKWRLIRVVRMFSPTLRAAKRTSAIILERLR